MGIFSNFFGGGTPPPPVVTQVPTTSNTNPWEPTEEPLKRSVAEAERLSAIPRTWAPFQTYTDLDPRSLAALGQLTSRSIAGNPLLPGGIDFLSGQLGGAENRELDNLRKTARGDYLNTASPYLLDALREPLEQVQGMYSQAGRLGSTANQQALAKAAAPFLLGEYGRERSLQDQAAQNLARLEEQRYGRGFQAASAIPGIGAERYKDPMVLAAAGTGFEQQAEKALQDRLAEFSFLQNEEWDRHQRLANELRATGGMGRSDYGTQPLISGGGGSPSGMEKLGGIMKLIGTGAALFCDYRLKDNIEPLPDGALDNVLKLKPKRYNYRAEYGFDSSTTEGFLAHEVQDVLPDAVTGTHNGAEPQMLDVLSVLATVTKAVQELCVKVDRLEKRLETNHGA